eukprot:scaffold192100_cov34-Attheya_sp.AAC.1
MVEQTKVRLKYTSVEVQWILGNIYLKLYQSLCTWDYQGSLGDDGYVCLDATTSFLVEEAILKDSWSSCMQGGSAMDPSVGATPKDPSIVTGSSLNFKTSSFCSLCANQDEDSMVDTNGTHFTTTGGVVPSNNNMVCIFF